MSFDPLAFYATYPEKVIGRPGYPARAQYKSTLLWSLYGRRIRGSISSIETYADIGGCFGFGANAMAYTIASTQERYPQTKVFEISSDFSKIGKMLFPKLEFIEESFTQWQGDPLRFDLVSLFDVIEHIPDPEKFLSDVAPRTKFALIKTPMETSGEWRGSRAPALQGEDHVDGHVNFFDPAPYMKMLERCGFEIVQWDLVADIVPRGIAKSILDPEERLESLNSKSMTAARLLRRMVGIPLKFSPRIFRYTRRMVGGGDHLCLVKSIV